MQKKLVIFDLDGTLLYTVPDIAAATNQALAACGYPVHSETEIASYIGNGINKLFERALPEEARSQEEEPVPALLWRALRRYDPAL